MDVGIALAFCASVCYALGNVFQKRAVDGMAAFDFRNVAHILRNLLSSWPWAIGAGLSVAGVLLQTFAFSRVAISVVQSVGVAGIILLAVLSRLYFKELFHRREMIGLFVAAGAFVLIGLSLNTSADSAGDHRASLALLISTLCAIGGVGIMFAIRALRDDPSGAVFGIGSGIFYGLMGIAVKAMSTLIIAHGWVASIGDSLQSAYPYMFLGAWFMGLVIFQVGIQRCRIGVVGPLSAMVSSAYVVAVGTPVFGEHLPPNAVQLVFRLVGFAGTLVGLALVIAGGPVVDSGPGKTASAN